MKLLLTILLVCFAGYSYAQGPRPLQAPPIQIAGNLSESISTEQVESHHPVHEGDWVCSNGVCRWVPGKHNKATLYPGYEWRWINNTAVLVAIGQYGTSCGPNGCGISSYTNQSSSGCASGNCGSGGRGFFGRRR